jgi:signal transduction histidine kinase
MRVSTRAHAMGAVVAAGGVVLLGAGDVHRSVPHLDVVLAARAVWAGALLGLAAYILRARDRQLPLPAAIAALASIAALAAIAWADRVSGTGAVSYLVAAPLFVALIVPDPRVAAVGAVASLAGTVAVGATVGLPGADVATIALRSAFAGAFAIFGSVLQERGRRTEVALAEERARAMEALAASERRRAEAEPLAVAGSRAAAAAHDMSGPIAAIRANLDWLDEALRDGRVRAADADVPAVLGDARQAVAALVRALSDLRRASDAGRRTTPVGGRPSERPIAAGGTRE